ncbi:MAG: outer membrane lipoprotein carrier protein LolA [Deltaproteobacteria bacterium]|nr:outer membrane lipoprotein carrier protein LolA [Deltaproteobacteria bacterium]MBW2676099.1 outer membrane lipoprotein carrier protein LolA [Deltaproteobacteria bacterium]
MGKNIIKTRRFFCRVLFIIAALACLGWADSWQELKSTAGTVTSVTAGFSQEKHMKILARPLVSQGKFLFKSPNSLRWEYTRPLKSILVLHNGKTRRFVQKDGRLVEDASAGLQSMQVVVQQITQWLNGRFDENPAFEASLAIGQKIVLSPRDAAIARLIQRIEILLSNRPGVIASVTIFESEDSFTKLIFQNVVLNTPLDDALFQQVFTLDDEQ